MQENVLWYENLGMNDVDRVGGKNASLGEMISNLAPDSSANKDKDGPDIRICGPLEPS